MFISKRAQALALAAFISGCASSVSAAYSKEASGTLPVAERNLEPGFTSASKTNVVEPKLSAEPGALGSAQTKGIPAAKVGETSIYNGPNSNYNTGNNLGPNMGAANGGFLQNRINGMPAPLPRTMQATGVAAPAPGPVPVAPATPAAVNAAHGR